MELPTLQLTRTSRGTWLYLFPAAWLRVVKRPGNTPEGFRWSQIAEKLQQLPPGSAALDGPMSGLWPPGTGTGSEVLGMHFDRWAGLYTPSWPGYDSRGITMGVRVNGTPFAMDGAELVQDAMVGVQCYPMLVRNGRSPGGFSRDSTARWRVGLASFSGNRLGFCAGPMPMLDFSQDLEAAGAIDAGYTDGGGSTEMLVPGRRIYQERPVENRAIMSWLFATPPPNWHAPSSSSSPWLLAGGLAAGVAGYLWWRKKGGRYSRDNFQ